MDTTINTNMGDDALAKAYADAYRDTPVNSHLAGLQAVAEVVTQELAKEQEPVAWIRFCSNGGIEGPLLDRQMDEVRKKSGAWTPLSAAPAAPKANPNGGLGIPSCGKPLCTAGDHHPLCSATHSAAPAEDRAADYADRIKAIAEKDEITNDDKHRLLEVALSVRLLSPKYSAAPADAVAMDADKDDIAAILKASEDFEDCNETSVDYETLMRLVNLGWLECTYFEVTEKGRAAIDAAMAANKTK